LKNICKYAINYHITKPNRPNHSFAEGVIREVRKKWFRIMVRRKVPQRLWDDGLQRVCEIQNRTSNSARGLDGKCPLEWITGESVNISEYLDFGFYGWAWCKENAGLGETKLGRWLGVLHRISTLMLYWVLTKDGKVLLRTTVQRVTSLELQTAENKARTLEFDRFIGEQLSAVDYFIQDGDGKVFPGDWGNLNEFNPAFQEEFDKVVSDAMLPEADVEFTPDIYGDTYVHMELAFRGVVVKSSSQGLPRGFETRTDYQSGRLTTTRCWIPEYTKSVTRHHSLLTQLPKTCSLRLIARESATSCLTKSHHIEPMGRK
jgi:hypothetical protein